MKNNALDMTQGDAFRLLTAFTLPTLAGNLLNQVYSITDSIIVGRYLGQTSLAAIGVCMPVILLTASMVIGLNVGVGILMSQSFGRKDVPQMRHILANSIYLAGVISFLTAAVGYPLTVPILKAMGTPDGPMKEAATYMHINFVTTMMPMMYFMLSNAFRGMGDSVTALYCLIVSVIANVFLDVLFVAVFGWGVAGSAIATALAQFMAIVFSVIMLYRKYKEMRLTKADFRVDLPLLKQVSTLAVPIAVQNSFNNFGNIIVQSCINGFGEAVMAAYTAASRLGTLSLMPVETAGNALSVYAGQNYGAGKHERIREGVRASWKLIAIISIILGALLVFAGKVMIGLFLPDPGPEITTAAYRYLLIAAVPGILDGIMCIYQQVLRGVGQAGKSVIGGFMQLGAKVIVALVGAHLIRSLDAVWMAWPLSFIVGTIYPFMIYRRLYGAHGTVSEQGE